MKITMRNKGVLAAVLIAVTFSFGMPTYGMGEKAALPAVNIEMKQTDDSKLSYKELQKKYPVEWFNSKYGSLHACEAGPGYKLEKGPHTKDWPESNYYWSEERCTPKSIVKELTDNEIKNIFVNFDVLSPDYRSRKIATIILKTFKNSGSEYEAIKPFILSKKVLINMKPESKKVIEQIPEELPYYKEMVLVWVDNNQYVHDYLPERYQNDPDVGILIIEKNLRTRKYSPEIRKKIERKLKYYKGLKRQESKK